MRRAGGYGGRVSAAPQPDPDSRPATGRWPRLIPGLVTIVVAATAAVLVASRCCSRPAGCLPCSACWPRWPSGPWLPYRAASPWPCWRRAGGHSRGRGIRTGAGGARGRLRRPLRLPLVVGLPLPQAKALFQRHGPVRFVIHRRPTARAARCCGPPAMRRMAATAPVRRSRCWWEAAHRSRRPPPGVDHTRPRVGLTCPCRMETIGGSVRVPRSAARPNRERSSCCASPERTVGWASRSAPPVPVRSAGAATPSTMRPSTLRNRTSR